MYVRESQEGKEKGKSQNCCKGKGKGREVRAAVLARVYRIRRLVHVLIIRVCLLSFGVAAGGGYWFALLYSVRHCPFMPSVAVPSGVSPSVTMPRARYRSSHRRLQLLLRLAADSSSSPSHSMALVVAA